MFVEMIDYVVHHLIGSCLPIICKKSLMLCIVITVSPFMNTILRPVPVQPLILAEAEGVSVRVYSVYNRSATHNVCTALKHHMEDFNLSDRMLLFACLQVLHVIAAYPNVCKQLHMPAQSGSTTALQRMKRGYSREAYDELVNHVREVLPNVTLSTDMIVGKCVRGRLDSLAVRINTLRCRCHNPSHANLPFL